MATIMNNVIDTKKWLKMPKIHPLKTPQKGRINKGIKVRTGARNMLL